MDFYKAQRSAWDRDYKVRGALWQGPVFFEFPFTEHMRVLELGCGNGKTFAALLRMRCRVTAIDFSPNAVEICKQVAKDSSVSGNKAGGSAIVQVADVLSLPFQDGSFDAVVAFHILGHLLEKAMKRAASEIHRVLVPGGKVYAQVFSTNDMRIGKGQEVEKGTFMRGTGVACHYFTEEELNNLFESAGFAKISSQRLQQKKKYEGKEMIREKLTSIYEKK